MVAADGSRSVEANRIRAHDLDRVPGTPQTKTMKFCE